jgi:hypothetical protein
MSGGVDPKGLPEFIERLAGNGAVVKNDHLTLAPDARRLTFNDEDIGGLA